MQIISTIQARANLYNEWNYSKAEAPKIESFQGFVITFESLFTSVRHNIQESGKIPKWDGKKYKDFFMSKTMESEENIEKSLELFDEFLDDLVVSGIYSLIEEIGIANEGFEEGDEIVEE